MRNGRMGKGNRRDARPPKVAWLVVYRARDRDWVSSETAARSAQTPVGPWGILCDFRETLTAAYRAGGG
jgi:hypothetical protein